MAGSSRGSYEPTTHRAPDGTPIRTVPRVLAGRVVAPETIASLATSINAAEAWELSRDLKASATDPANARLFLAFVEASRAWERLSNVLARCELAQRKSLKSRPNPRDISTARAAYVTALAATEAIYARPDRDR